MLAFGESGPGLSTSSVGSKKCSPKDEKVGFGAEASFEEVLLGAPEVDPPALRLSVIERGPVFGEDGEALDWNSKGVMELDERTDVACQLPCSSYKRQQICRDIH